MKGIYRIENDKHIIYAKGSVKNLNKIYDKIKKAYPQFEIFQGDIDSKAKCVGSERKYSYEEKII